MKRHHSRRLQLLLVSAGLAWVALEATRENPEELGGGGRGTDRASAGLPPGRQESRERPQREQRLRAGELVGEWSDSVSSAEGDSSGLPGIFVSSRPSPEREKAFRKLLAGMKQDNAGDLHDLLDACAPGEPDALSDEEWSAFLEKWGRLDGSGAAAHLEDHVAAAHRVPEMLRGWAEVEPDGADAWLRGLPEHPWLAAATTVYAATTVRWDAGYALDWALSIQGPWRNTALHLLESSWPAGASEEDRAAFETATSGLNGGSSSVTEDTPAFDLLRPQDWSGAESGSLDALGIHIAD